jgi:arsenate reductase
VDATIYHHPRCSTSRQALDRLREAGSEPTVVKYLDEGWTEDQLRRLFEAAGLTPAQAARKRDRLYDELGIADATDDEVIAAMVAHPVLVERPFVVTDKGTRLARPLGSLDDIL